MLFYNKQFIIQYARYEHKSNTQVFKVKVTNWGPEQLLRAKFSYHEEFSKNYKVRFHVHVRHNITSY